MTDTDLIRDFRGYVKGGGRWPDSLLSFATRLAAALEERGKQSSDRFDRARQAEASARHWEERALAAEQERDRLRAMAREIEQIISPDPYDERETDHGWMQDRIRAAIDAALTPTGPVGGGG